MSRYVAAYDISSDLHRTAVARVLLRFGERLQKSVFEVWLEPEEIAMLRCEVGPLLNDGDTLELIPIDQAPTRSRWRWGEPLDEYAPVVVLGR
jgi:CRISPR-associated endonuclease Cas2